MNWIKLDYIAHESTKLIFFLPNQPLVSVSIVASSYFLSCVCYKPTQLLFSHVKSPLGVVCANLTMAITKKLTD